MRGFVEGTDPVRSLSVVDEAKEEGAGSAIHLLPDVWGAAGRLGHLGRGEWDCLDQRTVPAVG